MASVNKVILVGRLGKDPEVRFTASGQAVANFSLATDETYKDKSGEKQKKTEWHNIVVWGNSVEAFVQPYLHKGDMVYIEGKLQTRSWEDKNGGGKKYTTEVNVLDIKGLVTGEGGQASSAPRQAAPTQRTANAQQARPAARTAARTAPPRQQAPAQYAPQEVTDEDIAF